MHVQNWILSLFNYPHRRKAVRELALSRDRVADRKKMFRQIKGERQEILESFLTLEEKGSTPKQLIDCLKRAKPLGSSAVENLSKFEPPLCATSLNLHGTPKNDAFEKRWSACRQRLEKEVESFAADVKRWVVELTPDDSELEARIVRLQEVDEYFAFSYAEFKPDLEFKRRMSAYGCFYEAHEVLSTFPYHVASWLRHKRYEWFVVGMEKNREVTLVWVNKGESNERVYLGVPASAPIPMDQLLLPRPADWVPRSAVPVIQRAVDEGFTSILMFHNHPHSQGERFRGWSISPTPSETDIETATRMAKNLGQLGINYLAFICQSGDPYLYHFSIADKFLRPSVPAPPPQERLNL